MPITFDSLDELKAFYRTFKLEEKEGARSANSATATAIKMPVVTPEKRKPGRPPKAEKATSVVKKAAPKKLTKTTPKKIAKTTVKNTAKKAVKLVPTKKTVVKAAPKAAPKATIKAAAKPAAKKVAKVAIVKPAKKVAKAAPKAAVKAPAKKTATKPNLKVVPSKAPKAKAAEATAKRPKGRPKAVGTLTSKIQDTIQKFIDNRREFTANEIFDDLSKREKGVNKQSVITSVLKQMNGMFSQVKVAERPGSGPRPVKVYIP